MDVDVNFGRFMYVDYDSNAPTVIGGTTSAIGTLTASADTVDKIVVMPNTTVTPSITQMFITEVDESGSEPSYVFRYVGNLAMDASAFILKSQIVDDLTTGGSNDVLSAEQGKVLKESIPIIESKIEKTFVSLGSVVSAAPETNGQILSSGGYKRTDYISVSEGDKIEVMGSASNTVYILSAFDSQKNFIANSEINFAGTNSSVVHTLTYTIPSGVAFVIVCGNNVTSPNAYCGIVTEGIFDNVGTLQKFSEDQGKLFWNNIPTSYEIETDVISNNIANPADVWGNSSVNNDGRVLTRDNLTNYKVEWLNVVPGQTVTFGGNDCGRSTYYAFYSPKMPQGCHGIFSSVEELRLI